MSHTPADAERLQSQLDRLRAGDLSARDALLADTADRFRDLAQRMLKDFGRVRRWEETDDVFQNAMLRLWTALKDVRPPTVREFCGLAALQIRRALLDLARQHFGPEGIGAHHDTRGDSPTHAAPDPMTSTYDPSRLAAWTEFHERVEALPPEEREAVDLVWYQGLPQGQAALLLGVSEPTLKRRWWSARRRLHEVLKDQFPGP
jgi:RNA polymerase sigma-70 factor (ECF subfamily)